MICALLFFSVAVDYIDRLVVGQILQKTGSYVLVFAYFSGMYVLSLVLIQVLVPVIGPRAARTVES